MCVNILSCHQSDILKIFKYFATYDSSKALYWENVCVSFLCLSLIDNLHLTCN